MPPRCTEPCNHPDTTSRLPVGVEQRPARLSSKQLYYLDGRQSEIPQGFASLLIGLLRFIACMQQRNWDAYKETRSLCNHPKEVEGKN